MALSPRAEGASRRVFLRGVSGAALSLLLPQPGAARETASPVLVCVNLVGGLDGMSLVVPYGEDDYYRARPHLAIPPAGRAGGALPLSAGFGLHPKLEPLYASFLDERLAIVHAVGGTHLGRSHFRARQIMHSAAPSAAGSMAIKSGWASRYAELGSSEAPGPRLFSTLDQWPAAFRGRAPVATLSDHRLWQDGGDDYLSALHSLYQGATDPFALAAEEALAQAAFIRERTKVVRLRGHYSKSGRGLRAAARLILADVGAEIIWIDVGGFDTHKAQGGEAGMLAQKLAALGQDLAAFRDDLGMKFADVVLVTLTEFGRTLEENGAGGTDHGTGSCTLVLGGGVRGGRLAGTWPGLTREALFERRDLAITTDYRAVLAALLTGHLRLDPTALAHVLPGFDVSRAPKLDLV
jgi:uncharacterized protein (DUF1501 family)